MRDSIQNSAKTKQFLELLRQIVEMENKYVHFDEVVEFGNDENGLVTDTKIKQGESVLENDEGATDKDKRIMAAIER